MAYADASMCRRCREYLAGSLFFARTVLARMLFVIVLCLLSSQSFSNEGPSKAQTISFIEAIMVRGRLTSDVESRIISVRVSEDGHFQIQFKTWGGPLVNGELQRISFGLSFDLATVEPTEFAYKCETGACVTITDDSGQVLRHRSTVGFRMVNGNDDDRLNRAIVHLKELLPPSSLGLFR